LQLPPAVLLTCSSSAKVVAKPAAKASNVKRVSGVVGVCSTEAAQCKRQNQHQVTGCGVGVNARPFIDPGHSVGPSVPGKQEQQGVMWCGAGLQRWWGHCRHTGGEHRQATSTHDGGQTYLY
jgi:hypothetical protein